LEDPADDGEEQREDEPRADPSGQEGEDHRAGLPVATVFMRGAVRARSASPARVPLRYADGCADDVRVRTTWVAAALAVVALTACAPVDRVTRSTPTTSPVAAPVKSVKPTSVTPSSPAAEPGQGRLPLLHEASRGGDGDSWKDTHGTSYRLGLVNAPEVGECYGSQATHERRLLLADGFRARVYTHDDYGRGVSEVFTASGTNVNVYLARHGFVNDKYLAEFRHENPALAKQLDVAFAAARRERAGLWKACAAKSSPQAAAPQGFVGTTSTSSCHPDYLTCIPVKGDGSGNGDANDLDCGDIGKKVTLRQAGVDPYRLDSDGDGFGCDSY
jgi:endonuclease YncB( thermonuclease family)